MRWIKSSRQFLFIAIALVFISLIAVYLYKSTEQSIIPETGFHYFLQPGTTPRQFIRDLQENVGLRDPHLIFLLIKEHPEKKLQVGEYFFSGGSSAQEVVEKVLNGQVMYHSFTIIDGWNIYQVLGSLEEAPLLKHTLGNSTPKEVAKILDMPYSSPEGWLLPETYFYTWNTPDWVLLNRAYVAMQNYLDDVWLQRASGLPYRTPYQALIVASMLEKEAVQASEMPVIADIVLKRLRVNMPLQMDSSVIYGMQPGFSKKLVHADLLVNTPYNTYLNKGLPPTPIAMPGKAAILAALNPQASSAWYFVAKGDGTHVFSATLADQNKAIDQYQKVNHDK